MSIKSLIGGLSVKASRTTAKAVLGLKKAAPEILLIGGIGVIIGGVYLACKETLQSEDILEEAGEKIEKVKTTMNDSELGYSEELARKAKVKIYAKTAGKLCKLYAPAALCVGGGIAMILKSHGIMKTVS